MNCKRLLLVTCALLAIATIFLIAGTNTESSDADSEAYDIWIMGQQITTENKDDVFGDGKVSVEYVTGTGDVPEHMRITLSDAKGDTYTAKTAEQLKENCLIYSFLSVRIVINGDNELVSEVSESFGIETVDCDLTISSESNTSKLSIKAVKECIVATNVNIGAYVSLDSKRVAISANATISAPAVIKGTTNACSSVITATGMAIRASITLDDVSIVDYNPETPTAYQLIFVDINGVYVNGNKITYENMNDIPLSGENAHGEYDFVNKILTLENAIIDSGYEHMSVLDYSTTDLGIYSSQDMKIIIKGDCIIRDGHGILVIGALEITTDLTGHLSTTADIISPGTFKLNNPDSEEPLGMDLHDATSDAVGSIISWNNIEVNNSTLSMVGTETVSKGLAAGRAIWITNKSAITIGKCAEFKATEQIMITNSTVEIAEVPSMTSAVIGLVTSEIKITNSENGIIATNGAVSIAGTVLTLTSGDTAIQSTDTITLDIVEVKLTAGNKGINSEGNITIKNVKMDITLGQDVSSLAIHSQVGTISITATGEYVGTSYVRIQFNEGNAICYGIHAGSGDDMKDVTIGCPIWVTSTASSRITAIRCATLTITGNGALDLSLTNSSIETYGIYATTINLDAGSTISINVSGKTDSSSMSFGIRTTSMAALSSVLNVSSLSKNRSAAIYVDGDANIECGEITLKSTSTAGESDGLFVSGNTILSCPNFKFSMNGSDYGNLTYAINSATATLAIAGEIQVSSDDAGYAIMTAGALTMSGTGSLNMFVTAQKAYGIVASQYTVSDSLSLSFTSNLTNPGAGSVITAIMVTTSVTVNNSVSIKIKSKGATENKGVQAESLTMNGGSMEIDANTRVITCTDAIVAPGYVTSHTQEVFESGVTKELTATVNSVVKFAIGIDITIVSNNTDYGTVSLGSMTVPTGSVAHITIDNPNIITIAGLQSVGNKMSDTAAYTYAFEYWSVEDGEVLTETTTITATFSRTANIYNIKLMLNGGNSSYIPEGWKEIKQSEILIGYEMDLAYGEKINKISDPFKTGYQFVNWDPTLPSTMGDSDCVYQAVYEIHTNYMTISITGYETVVHYRLNDGDPILYDEMNVPLIEYDTKVTVIPTDVLGYTYEVMIGTEIVTVMDFYMPDEPVQIKISYMANIHKITINTNGGAYDKDPTGWTPIKGMTGEIVAYERNLSFDDELAGILPDGPVKKGWAFNGWDPVPPAKMPDNDVNLTATFYIMSYKVTIYTEGAQGHVYYTVNGGTEILYSAPFNVDYGSKVFIRAADIPEYTTKLLSENVTIYNGEFNMPDKDVTVHAIYTANPYNLTIMLNGGSYTSEPVGWIPIYEKGTVIGYTRTFGYDEEIKIDKTPSMTGYSFLAWDPALPQTMPNRDIVTTAQYVINEYTVTFNVTGGTGTMHYIIGSSDITEYIGPFKATYGYNVTVIPFEVEHYHETMASEQVVLLNNSFTVPGCDVDISIDYTLNTHLITLRLNGGSYATDPEGWDRYIYSGKLAGYQREYAYGDAVTFPDDPAMEGYVFKGWDPDKSTVTTMPDKSITLDAKYNISTFKVTLNAESGTELTYRVNDGNEQKYTEPISVTYGYYVTVSTAYVPGYTLLLESSDIEITGTSFKVPAKDITVTASYKISNKIVVISSELPNAKIYYSIDGGLSQLYSGAFALNAGKTVTMECKPVDGYESATFTSKDVVLTDNSFVMGDINVTINVMFVGKEYTLKLDMGGGYYTTDPEGWDLIITEGSVTGYSKVFRCGDVIILPSETPQRTGYAFSVWSGGVPVVMPAKDTNLVATYIANTYLVKWMNEGSEYSVQALKYDSVIVPPVSPTKKDSSDFSYKFDRWEGYKSGMTVTGEMTFNALYKAVAKTYIPSSAEKSATITTNTYSTEIPLRITDKIQQDIENKAVENMLITLNIGKISMKGDVVLEIDDNINFAIYTASAEDITDSQRYIVGDRPIFRYESDTGDLTVTVSFMYEIKDGEDPNGLFIMYLKENGDTEKINGTYSDGYISFEVSHNSLFSVMYEKPTPANDINYVLYVCIGLAALIIAILVIHILAKRSKRIKELN